MNEITNLIKHDILPNLPYYLLQIFLIVLMVIVFAFVNIVVRFITDPLCIKVLRMKENKRGPGTVGFVISAVIMVFLLIFAYNAFPQLQPTVIGWTGKQLQKVVTWDFEGIPDKVNGAPETIES
jgi:Na+/proline symporter